MIGIIDCSIGNIGSLMNAFAYLGKQAEVVHDPAQLSKYRAAVLPGVGAFDAAMGAIRRSGFDAAVSAYAASGAPLLGICLGMQILCAGSEEGELPGLGLLDGRVMKLQSIGCRGKVPHIGFNSVARVSADSPFLQSLLGRDFYFVHSFALPAASASVGVASVEYDGASFIAALRHENIFATQFHPEKSGSAGLALLEQFISC